MFDRDQITFHDSFKLKTEIITLVLLFVTAIINELHVVFRPFYAQQVLLLRHYFFHKTRVILPKNTCGKTPVMPEVSLCRKLESSTRHMYRNHQAPYLFKKLSWTQTGSGFDRLG